MALIDMYRKKLELRMLATITPFAIAIACAPPPRAVVLRSGAPLPAPGPVNPPPVVLGQLPVDQVIIPTRPATPLELSAQSPADRISLRATNANVRELIPALAAQAGISVVMTPDVSGRVSVYLKDVSALDALRAVISEAGLTVGEDVIPQPFGPAVFFQLPVNVNTASAPLIKARFAVSDSVANWIVRARTW